MVITTGMSMEARITSGPRMLGNTWKNTSRGQDAPNIRSASRNGALLSVSVCERATRPKCGTSVTATITTTIPVDGPNTATTASASTRLGNDEMTSKTMSTKRSLRAGR